MSTGITATTETKVHAPAEKVWQALTDPEMIRKYFFGTNTKTDWKVGSPIVFEGEYQGKSYHDKGTIRAVEKNKMLQYDYWSSMSKQEDKPENYFLITYRLRPEGAYTVLTVTQENIPSEEQRDHSASNWNMVLENLKKMVEGNNS